MVLADSLIAEIASWWPCTVQAAERFLGIEVSRDVFLVTKPIHLILNIKSTVSRYACDIEHDTLLPVPRFVHFTKQGAEMGEYLQGKFFRTLVVPLSHLSQCIHPESACAVGLLSRYISAPKLGHWGAATCVHVLRYIKRTSAATIN